MLPLSLNNEKKPITLQFAEIERIAKRLFTLKEWTKDFGKPIYYLRSAEAVRKILNEKNIADEWDIYNHGYRCYVFLSEDKVGKIKNESQIKLSPAAVERIHKTDFSKRGVQRQLARELGIHECHISRVRRGIRRPEKIKAKSLSEKDKKNLFLSRSEVTEFFNQVWTAKEFFGTFREEYKITSLRDVYDMCANRGNFKLPESWHTIRVGETWLIYYSPV